MSVTFTPHIGMRVRHRTQGLATVISYQGYREMRTSLRCVGDCRPGTEVFLRIEATNGPWRALVSFCEPVYSPLLALPSCL